MDGRFLVTGHFEERLDFFPRPRIDRFGPPELLAFDRSLELREVAAPVLGVGEEFRVGSCRR